jgi:decaprenylphospho-beta-D-ribofuranose 2-oxidase
MQKTAIATWGNALPTETWLATYGGEGTAKVSDVGGPFIPRGAGRSFSDAAYLTRGVTLSSRDLSSLHEIDFRQRTVICGGGTPMIDLHLALEATPLAFPVFGGTQLATAGGAVASDIHGKNHAATGSFGDHVVSIGVATADGGEVECTPDCEHRDLFAATIGGMGLTGLITSVKLRLEPRRSSTLRVRTRAVANAAEAIAAFEQSTAEFEFCSWVDLAGRPGGGLYYYADRVEGDGRRPRTLRRSPLPRVRVLQRPVVALMDAVRRVAHRRLDQRVHIRTFNYSGPHEVFFHWNRLYGGHGVIEYQFATPRDGFAPLVDKLARGARERSLPLLMSVVKRFARRGRGLLSFPAPGYTLCFQVPNSDAARRFLQGFTDDLIAAGGHVYLAKDSCVRADQLERMYAELPAWREIARRYDPANRLRSDLSNRLKMKPWS